MRRTLDTNICSYILRRHPANMIERFATLDRSELWLSVFRSRHSQTRDQFGHQRLTPVLNEQQDEYLPHPELPQSLFPLPYGLDRGRALRK